MSAVRTLLAVVLAVALLGVSLPPAERVERDRNAALASQELEVLAEQAERLSAGNDPVPPGAVPAGTTVTVEPPSPVFTDGGRLVIDEDRLAWVPRTGREVGVDIAVPLRVEAPIEIVDRTRLRLSLHHEDGREVVRVERGPPDEPPDEGSERIGRSGGTGVGDGDGTDRDAESEVDRDPRGPEREP